ncbi:MAG: uroporphyrinogen-III synthase [Burkholderiaceae bacterium]|nr:uroporphyrinogen-III synthase [Burkholderiaceae bacterium]
MRVLVTRPAVQAADWVHQLCAAGIDALALPLISLTPPADASAVQAAWFGLARQRLLVFVSPSAAEYFFALRPQDVQWPSALQVASPGPGTSQALQRLGVPPSRIVEPAADSEQFDTQALWVQLARQDWQDANVLIVRGNGGREWLTDKLREQGASVNLVTAYCRTAPNLNEAQRALLRDALDLPEQHLWFFSSSEAIDNLAVLTGAAADWSHARALVTHPRIAARAHDLGLGQVFDARPTLSAVQACIQSITL